MFWKKLFGSRSDATKRAMELVQEYVDTGQPLRVIHYSYFANAAQQQEFVAKIAGLGFQVDRTHGEAPGKLPFSVAFSRLAVLNTPEFNESCSELGKLAASLSGDYDGWEVALPSVGGPVQ